MRIVLFVVTVLSLLGLSIYKSREDNERASVDGLRTQIAQVDQGRAALQGAATAISAAEPSGGNSEQIAAIQADLQKNETTASQLRERITALPQRPAAKAKLGAGTNPQVATLQKEVQIQQQQQQVLRQRLQSLETTTPTSTAIKTKALAAQPSTTEATQPEGNTDQIFYVQVGLSGVFGLAALLMMFRTTTKENREWAFGTIGTILGFWLKS